MAETNQTYEQKQEERSVFAPAPKSGHIVVQKPVEQAQRLVREVIKPRQK
jgi:hypothetical protein